MSKFYSVNEIPDDAINAQCANHPTAAVFTTLPGGRGRLRKWAQRHDAAMHSGKSSSIYLILAAVKR